MLEVNDFNAIKISLASPDQIREWSFGEVTKPETINYRTLRPERDGLFCERIFGPTKDWECYCGKYKRIRFKGVVCEKCGVEVARSRVRRERMGHIQLASPVSHIWYFKGTPSRLGLLLDISPRNLERVLYFATYIVTSVDEEEISRLRAELDERLNERTAEIETGLTSNIAELDEATRGRVASIEAAGQTSIDQLRAQQKAELDAIDEEASQIEELLTALQGQAATEQVVFGDGQPWRRVLLEEGEAINETRLEELREAADAAAAQVEQLYTNRMLDAQALMSAEREQLIYAGASSRDQANEEARKEVELARRELEERRRLLDQVRPMSLLTETEYRQMQDEFGMAFTAGMGAEAVLQILKGVDLDGMAEELRLEMQSSSGQRRKKATKRLRVVEAFRKSGNRPEWMIFTSLPVIPPDLRPMVQLDGGRFATSDLNDLYRRVINRNNRLQRLINLGAPEIIVRNEKRMLQEAVDALIDNGRRGRPVAGSSKHKLKSLSDMLKGKQGRFRQNLLGKRVDYSGRSVIVVGPDLALHQCGLPKKMALELFKPFVMRRLVQHGHAVNIKSAKRIVERMRPEVWDVLEEVTREYLVLLNRAPTLHRLGIQAFEPKLIEGSAIQLHPLVTSAFNADFDGDQMAVHVPLSQAAQSEARQRMLSKANLLLPSNGDPVITPTQDIVLGVYYMTLARPGAKGSGKIFSSPQEAELAYELGHIDLQAPIHVRLPENGVGAPERTVETTVGRLIFTEALPPAMQYRDDLLNMVLGKPQLRRVVAEVYRRYGPDRTAEVADTIKRVGFRFSTRGGVSISVEDVRIPENKDELLNQADDQVREYERDYQRGLMTEDEREIETVRVWTDTREQLTRSVQSTLDPYGSISMMATSGAKGNMQQISQMAGMRGLMADPSGRIISLPIRSNFREGLSVLEYFISTHGARKGLADTALRTADSGYLTRRLVDVAQDVIIADEDCGTREGLLMRKEQQDTAGMIPPLRDRILGRLAAAPVVDPDTGEVLAERDQELTEEVVDSILASSVQELRVRTPLVCRAESGLCRKCYGRDLATGMLVELGEAVGIIAAQSIGEPGTQLTMRTFHTGGVALESGDITSGLPRVEELFEARNPKGQATLSEQDGVVFLPESEDGSRRVRIVSNREFTDVYTLPEGAEVLIESGQNVAEGTQIARVPNPGADYEWIAVTARTPGQVVLADGEVRIQGETREEKEYTVPATARLRVEEGQEVSAGEQLTEGSINPHEILRVKGQEEVQRYLVDEVQRVYRSQGVNTNDKHIEVIVRQMMRKVTIEEPGDTTLLPGELIDRFTLSEYNTRILAEGGVPATAYSELLGVTKASLRTSSFLSAASFQETTRVLTEAAINGSIDQLRGLKENVIIGKLIPAGSGWRDRDTEDFAPEDDLALIGLMQPD
ncbi:MAG: DNA-directed RNA polymerase subunit beta' [Chloroflexota bacterium]|nr:DNA-directed RNA polymerase subunit beta' [Chloroflexota bacterium]